MLPPTDITLRSYRCSNRRPSRHQVWRRIFGRDYMYAFRSSQDLVTCPTDSHASSTHPPFTRSSCTCSWNICMEKISASRWTIDTLTVEQLGHVASQLKFILAQLRFVESSKMLGSVSGRAHRIEIFPTTCGPETCILDRRRVSLDYYREM
jgi:hypothetical protein